MIGQTVSHYKILEKLGEGGMGVVYKAQDTKLDRLVALKFLPPEAVADEETHERFYAEAKAAAALDHPNIATVHEVNDVDDQMYIAMAYIDGEGIDHRVKAGPLAIRDAVDYATQAAQGLAAAHAKGVVHRDIKSANIMVKEDGRVVILDFGLATRHGTGDTGLEGTSGTMAYMAPEQAKGESVDHRADIWALGITLFEMLTGRLPFAGEYGEALMYSILNADAPAVGTLREGVPDSLQSVVAKALTKNPEERYASAADMVADLKRATREMEAGEQPAGRRRTIDFRALFAWIGGTLAAIYLTFTIVGMLTNDGEASDVPAVAVFPFENTRSTEEFDWLSQEIARTLTFKLGQLSNIKVVDQLQIKTALDKLGVNESNLSLEALSRQGSEDLGAELGLVGSFTTYGDSMRVLASLVDLDSRVVTPLLEEIYSTSDLLGMQSQVAAKITDQITAMNPEPAKE